MANNYFSVKVENSIITYNVTTGSLHRDIIYKNEIHRPLNKLVENVIHKFKFYQYESTYQDLKHDTVTFLYDRLHNYSKEKGKAFSYFTIIARNYLIAQSKELYSATSNKTDIEFLDDHRNITNEVHLDNYRDLLSSFIHEWSSWGISNVNVLFHRDRDRRVAEAVFVIFRDRDDIENYNKKALYILIREQARVKTQYITRVVNRLKRMFMEMVEVYLKDGKINWTEYQIKYVAIDKEEV